MLTADDNVASAYTLEGDGQKYPYKDKEHWKSTSLNYFFFLLSLLVHISYKTKNNLYLHSAKRNRQKVHSCQLIHFKHFDGRYNIKKVYTQRTFEVH